MNLLVTDFGSCRGCLFFQNDSGENCRALEVRGDDVLCSNMRVTEPVPVSATTSDEGYRLTAGDIVFFSESGD
jgi:hypothetical protein